MIKEILNNKKLSIDELNTLTRLLRGYRLEIAERAGVSKRTVDDTFGNVRQNEKVLEVAAEMIKELKGSPTISELRTLLSE